MLVSFYCFGRHLFIRKSAARPSSQVAIILAHQNGKKVADGSWNTINDNNIEKQAFTKGTFFHKPM